VVDHEDELPEDEAPPLSELPEDNTDPVIEIPEDEAAFLNDAFPSAPPGTSTALPPRIEAWRKRSAAGAILTGFALGLQEALEKRKEEPGIVMQTSGDPPKDLPVEADFEYGRPRQSVVQIRPWLLGDQPAATTQAATEKADAPPPSGQADPRDDDDDRSGPAGES
jgi:hypothetical protein